MDELECRSLELLSQAICKAGLKLEDLVLSGQQLALALESVVTYIRTMTLDGQELYNQIDRKEEF